MEGFVSVENIISEIASMQYFKDNPILLDKLAMYRWAKLALGKFGQNILSLREKIIYIDGYSGELPNDFKRLSLGIKVEMDYVGFDKPSDCIPHDNHIWNDRVHKHDDCDVKYGCIFLDG